MSVMVVVVGDKVGEGEVRTRTRCHHHHHMWRVDMRQHVTR